MMMTKARKIALGLSLAATALAGTAYAAQAAKDHAPVTRAEAQAKAQEAFARMDVNHDGKLDQAEIERMVAEADRHRSEDLQLRREVDARNELEVTKDYAAPGKPGYVVRMEAGHRVLSTMKWGFPTRKPRKRPARSPAACPCCA